MNHKRRTKSRVKTVSHFKAINLLQGLIKFGSLKHQRKIYGVNDGSLISAQKCNVQIHVRSIDDVSDTNWVEAGKCKCIQECTSAIKRMYALISN